MEALGNIRIQRLTSIWNAELELGDLKLLGGRPIASSGNPCA